MFEHLPEDDDKPLSSKQKRFIDKFVETRSVKLAAEAVGVSQGCASTWKNKPKIKAEIELRERESSARAGISNEWIINEIKDVAIMAKDDGSWAAAIKGLETLAKINGMFDDSKNDGVSYNVMGSVILAPNPEAAQALLEKPDADITADYEIMDFNIGDDVD